MRWITAGAIAKCLSTAARQGPSTKKAILSSERCIFRNLALEEYILSLVARCHEPLEILLGYRSQQSVVIGRNQNAWQECAVGNLLEDGVHLARRHSGGGAVYHDDGNACISFIVPRQRYRPADNMAQLQMFLRELWSDRHSNHSTPAITTTSRHDLFWNEKKVSGSAMRLLTDAACHHCTLLVASHPAAVMTYLKAR